LLNVKVHTILDISRVIGDHVVDITVPKGCTVKALIDEMVKTWGQELASILFEENSHKLFPYIHIMVNNEDIIFFNGMETVLSDGDDVLIVPPVFGG
jgi:molybdopterin converting factor small subunit